MEFVVGGSWSCYDLSYKSADRESIPFRELLPQLSYLIRLSTYEYLTSTSLFAEEIDTKYEVFNMDMVIWNAFCDTKLDFIQLSWNHRWVSKLLLIQMSNAVLELTIYLKEKPYTICKINECTPLFLALQMYHGDKK